VPYSGPASAYGIIGKTEEAYFKMINENGGINGRKIKFISYDDAYSPPKAVEQVRKLVESDEVLVVFNALGTPSNTAIQKYLNSKKVPQLFVATGATKWNDPTHFPWTIGWQPSYQSEARIYAKFLMKEKPNAKVAVLYQNDDFGKDYLKGLKDGFGAKAINDHRRGKLRGLGADDRQPHRQAQGQRRGRPDQHHDAEIRGADHQEDGRDRLEGAPDRGQRLDLGRRGHEAGGFENGQGVLSAHYAKDAGDAQWKDDPGMKKFLAFLDKYYPDADRSTAR
jgi:branched-chain amino acid transport system substrate-binding protein